MSARARGTPGLVAVVLCGIAVAAVPARADRAAADGFYQDAVRALDQLRLEQALPLLDQAWRAGDNPPERVRTLFRRAGETAATTGDRAAALDWFRRLVALDPDAELAAGTSPKIAELLEQARRELAGAALAVEVHAVAGGGAGSRTRTVEVALTNPAGLAERLELRPARGAAIDQPVGRRSRWRMDLDHAASGPAVVTVRDRFHNALLIERATLTWPEAAAPPRLADPAQVGAAGQPPALLVRGGSGREPPTVLGRAGQPRPRPPWYARWQTWAIGSGALLVTGGVLEGVSLSARSDLDTLNRSSAEHEGSEAVSLESRMQHAAVAAQVAAGAAVGAGVAAVICWRRESSLAPVPLVADHAVGVALEGHF